MHSQLKSTQLDSHANTEALAQADAKNIAGFTLVELSIVIVIIGLIVAGITAGQSLVKQARVRAALTNINELKTAILTFKLQYNYLPGDLPTASQYFSSGCPDVGSSKCNGNGNGAVDQVAGFSEAGSVFVHLTLSRILAGTYTKVDTSSGNFSNGGNFDYDAVATYSLMNNGNTGWGKGNSPPKLILSSIRYDNSSFYADATNLATIDVASMDKKIDDGIAYSGRMLAQDGIYRYQSSTTVPLKSCSDAYSQTSPSDYNLTSTVKSCRIFIEF